MKRPDFYPVRSLIYVDLAHEDYRIKLENWLYRYHILDLMYLSTHSTRRFQHLREVRDLEP